MERRPCFPQVLSLLPSSKRKYNDQTFRFLYIPTSNYFILIVYQYLGWIESQTGGNFDRISNLIEFCSDNAFEARCLICQIFYASSRVVYM